MSLEKHNCTFFDSTDFLDDFFLKLNFLSEGVPNVLKINCYNKIKS